MSGRLVLLSVAATAPVGVLTWPAWSALRDAATVYAAADLDPRWATALGEAWVSLHPIERPDPQELAAMLVSQAADLDLVVWFGSPDGDPGLAEAIAQRIAAGPDPTEVEIVLGSWERPGSQVLELVEVMDRLRSPGGCPWDAEQTHASLVPYVIEEAHEVVEAVETGDQDHLVEELGDLLLQVVFHARVGEEGQTPFTLDDVAAGISDKLRRRHPHVFADGYAPTAAHVEANWEEIKRAEKGRESVFDGVPAGLPSLARADAVLTRYSRAGIEVPARVAGSTDLGADLLALVLAARAQGVDAEAVMRAAVRGLEQTGRNLESSSLAPGPEEDYE
ncbi:MAG: MazG family protein [Actinomycetales bacterium]